VSKTRTPNVPEAFKIDARVAAHTVGLFVEKSWLLRIQCGGCGHHDRLTAARLAELPAQASIGEVVARLRCSACGGASGFVDYLQDRGEL
jgi:hypothetical protein